MDSQWLKSQFQVSPDKTKADLARALGFEPPAISKILSGRRQIKAQEYIRMRDFFGLGGGTQTQGAEGKRVDKAKPLSYQHMHDRNAPEPEWVMPYGMHGKRQEDRSDERQIRLFQISDAAMEPRFYKGESVIADMADRDLAQRGTFVITDGHEFFARYCSLEKSSGTYACKVKIDAESHEFEPQIVSKDYIRIIGRIIGKMVWI